MIQKTFEDYHPQEFNLKNHKLDEYLDVIANEQLETQLGIYLQDNPENIVTMGNMPWLDLGELPISYNYSKQEAFQVFMVPMHKLPFSVIVQYSSWHGQFDQTALKAVYDKAHFRDKDILPADLEDTLTKASQLLANYRGKIAERDRKVVYGLIGAAVFAFFLAIIIGMTL